MKTQNKRNRFEFEGDQCMRGSSSTLCDTRTVTGDVAGKNIARLVESIEENKGDH
jgi:hypothetical protein